LNAPSLSPYRGHSSLLEATHVAQAELKSAHTQNSENRMHGQQCHTTGTVWAESPRVDAAVALTGFYENLSTRDRPGLLLSKNYHARVAVQILKLVHLLCIVNERSFVSILKGGQFTDNFTQTVSKNERNLARRVTKHNTG
jgi:hypothetical protein